MQDILDLSRWAIHLRNTERTFSELKVDFNYWMVRNGVSVRVEDGVVETMVSHLAAPEAEIRLRSMDDVAKAGLRSAVDRDEKIQVLERYDAVCRREFPEVFKWFSSVKIAPVQ